MHYLSSWRRSCGGKRRHCFEKGVSGQNYKYTYFLKQINIFLPLCLLYLTTWTFHEGLYIWLTITKFNYLFSITSCFTTRSWIEQTSTKLSTYLIYTVITFKIFIYNLFPNMLLLDFFILLRLQVCFFLNNISNSIKYNTINITGQYTYRLIYFVTDLRHVRVKFLSVFSCIFK